MSDYATQSGTEIAERFPALPENVADRLLNLLLPCALVPGSCETDSTSLSGKSPAPDATRATQSEGMSSEPLAS